jgi:hypothetical protein
MYKRFDENRGFDYVNPLAVIKREDRVDEKKNYWKVFSRNTKLLKA